jgi:hypothetical protein
MMTHTKTGQQPSEQGEEEQVQAVRVVYKNGDPAAGYALAADLHVACHLDAKSGRQVILWEDVIMPFKDVLYVQSGTKILHFLKGTDLKR